MIAIRGQERVITYFTLVIVTASVFLNGCGKDKAEKNAAEPESSSADAASNGTGKDDALVGDTNSEPKKTSSASLCQSSSEVACSKQKACIPEIFEIMYASEDDCRKIQTANCESLYNFSDITQLDLAACAKARSAMSCDDFIAGVVLPECKSSPGSRAAGIKCQISSQCQSLHCVTRSNSECGTCDPNPLEPSRALGESCDSVSDCAGFLSCVGGTCRTPVADGFSCTDDSECNLLSSCLDSGTCERIDVAKLGERCGQLADGSYVICEGQYYCDQSSKVCVPKGEAGAKCDISTPCRAPLSCVNGVCGSLDSKLCPAEQAPSPMLKQCEICDSDFECATGYVCGRTTADAEGGFCVSPPGTTRCCLGGQSGNLNISLCLYVDSSYHR